MADTIHNGHRARMKNRFLQHGLDVFEQHQVLEMVLFYVIPRRDTNPLAHKLLEKFGNLSDVLDANYEHLCQVEGVSKQTALFLSFCGDLVGRYLESKVEDEYIFRNYEELGKFLQAKFFNETTEKLRLVCLNNRGKLLNCSVISEGTVNATSVNLRLLIQTAVSYPTTAVVLAHNHPGGTALPSSDDYASTIQIRDALSSLDIRLVDHMVFAQDDYISMRKTPFFATAFVTKMSDDNVPDWFS